MSRQPCSTSAFPGVSDALGHLPRQNAPARNPVKARCRMSRPSHTTDTGSACHRGGEPMHTRRDERFTLIPGTTTGLRPLTRSWWLMLLRGVASILFGIAAFIWPALTVLALTLLYGAFAMADGILSLGAALRGSGDRAIPTGWLVV